MQPVHLELMRVEDREFPGVPEPSAIVSAHVWHCKFRTLGPISRLRNLEVLLIATYPDETFEPLSKLSRLRHLSVLHMPRIQRLDPLSRLAKLEVLKLHVLPSWGYSYRTTIVESLEPIAGLQRLQHLELAGIVTPDRLLSSIERLRRLETAGFRGYPKKEVERFLEATGVHERWAADPDLLGSRSERQPG